MKKIVLFAAILAVTNKTRAQDNPCKPAELIAAAEKAAFQKRMQRPLNTLASSNFTVNYYRCEWNINPAKNFISGTVTSYFITTQSTSSLTYDLANQLTVDSVRMRNKKLTISRGTNNTLTITLPSAYAAGRKDSISIYYQGVPPSGGFGSFVQTTHSGTPVIWTLSEPYGAKDWWPCRNGVDDKADSIDIYVTHPSKYKLSSNGLQVSRIIKGTDATTHYKHRYPVASYLVAIAVTNFATFTENVQLKKSLLPVITYVYPEDSAFFRNNNHFVLDAMKLYDSVWADYPFANERYGETQFSWGGGMEHQTNSFVTSPDEGLVAHELAHQWFGDKITCGSWRDIWLNEGWATYNAHYLYNERYHPDQVKQTAISDRTTITILPTGSVFVDDTSSVNRIFDSRLSYSKGGFVLRTLRMTLGDKAFFRGVRKYNQDPLVIYNFARTSDFQRNMEAASGKDLDYFFNKWIYGKGYPSITVNWSQTGSGAATVKVSETTSHVSVPFYKIKLPLLFKNNTQSKLVYLDVNTNNQSFSVTPGFAADTVIIDPDIMLISKNNKSIRTTLSAGIAFNVSPNPFTNTLQVLLDTEAGKKGIMQLMDNTGHVFASSSFTTTGKGQKLQLAVNKTIPSGLYQLHITVDGKNSMQAVIKE